MESVISNSKVHELLIGTKFKNIVYFLHSLTTGDRTATVSFANVSSLSGSAGYAFNLSNIMEHISRLRQIAPIDIKMTIGNQILTEDADKNIVLNNIFPMDLVRSNSIYFAEMTEKDITDRAEKLELRNRLQKLWDRASRNWEDTNYDKLLEVLEKEIKEKKEQI